MHTSCQYFHLDLETEQIARNLLLQRLFGYEVLVSAVLGAWPEANLTSQERKHLETPPVKAQIHQRKERIRRTAQFDLPP